MQLSVGRSDIEAWIVPSADPGAAGTVAIGETLRRGPLADCRVDVCPPLSALESHLMEGYFFS